jgi:lysophospholipase L1-like esterase
VPYEPPAKGAQRTGDPERPRLDLLVLGDSTATGQGAAYGAGIAAGAARALAGEGRFVVWRNLAVSGATWSDVRTEQLAGRRAPTPDVVLISAGANDVTGATRTGALRRDIAAVVGALRRANPAVQIAITGVPDMGSTPRLAQPLRWLAGVRARRLNRAVREEGARLGVTVIPILERTGPLFRRDRGLFSADRFHPNARGYAVWRAVISSPCAGAEPPGQNSVGSRSGPGGSRQSGASWRASLTARETSRSAVRSAAAAPGARGAARGRRGVQPRRLGAGLEDHRHAVVKLADRVVGRRRDDRAGAQDLVARARATSPTAPRTRTARDRRG